MRIAGLAIVVTLVAGPATQAAPGGPRAVLPGSHRLFLERHCGTCHGAERQEGRVRLDDLPLAIGDLETADRWQKVLGVLNAGEMPPADEPRPDGVATADFLDFLANALVVSRKDLGDRGGTVSMRRLNRREYAATLRELLGAEIDVSELPTDGSTTGFDTQGASLAISGSQFEQYLALGRDAVDDAFQRRAEADIANSLHVETETTPHDLEFQQDHRKRLDAADRGRRWMKAVEEAAARPENAALVAALPAKDPKDPRPWGVLYRDWARISGAPSPESFGFNPPGENAADKAAGSARYETSFAYPATMLHLSQPGMTNGSYIANSWRDVRVQLPADWPPGDYVVRFRLATTGLAAPERRFVEFGLNPRAGQLLETREVSGTMDEPQVIEIPLSLSRKLLHGADRLVFLREKGHDPHPERLGKFFNDSKHRNKIGPELALWVDWMEIERVPLKGKPVPPGIATLGLPLEIAPAKNSAANASSAQTVATKHDATQAASPTEIDPADLRGAFARFCREAFRGLEPSAAYVDKLLDRYAARRAQGDAHGAALRETLAVVLASPMFLYLAEPAPAGARQPLSGQELAVRLSYFLWGGPPDRRLMDLAASGALASPEVLAAQVDRLLDDPRSDGFVRPFVHQWLGLDRLDFFEFSWKKYPRFDASVKRAAREEVYETFRHLLRENESVANLLAADFVVVNAVLADYYGLDGVTGDAFRAVPLPEGSPRGGLLGMAAVLAMGGNGEVTSPVERGAWVLRKLLHDPPPPAPANVPALSRLAGRSLTTRERVLAHQELPQCASCHRKIDPIGFGLENFDAVGAWRTTDSSQALLDDGRPDPAQPPKTWTIDPSGALSGGPAFTDYFGLRGIVAARAPEFSRGLAEALVAYALGRPCGFSDEPLVDAMIARATEHDLGLREFIHALVASEAFRTK